MRRLIYIVAFFTGMYFNCSDALAQADGPFLSHLTTNDGLSFNTILAIHQDERGFMYFQTWKGIDRYDGIEFHNTGAYLKDTYKVGIVLWRTVWAIYGTGLIWPGITKPKNPIVSSWFHPMENKW